MSNLSRRGFLSSAALAAPAALSGCVCPKSEVKPFKVCVFADIHYVPGYFTNTENISFLEKIQARAEAAGCDMMIHLGDFVHGVKSELESAYVKRYNDFKIPSYHCLGNHDQDRNTTEETCEAYRMPKEGYYSFDKGGFRFVVADPNYFCNTPGEFIHHNLGNYYKRVKGSTINWIPPAQLEWMRSVIVGSPYPCIVLSHQSFERGPAGAMVMNKDDVQAIFREANEKKPGTVRLVANGHLHMDYLRVLDNILYWDVNSANYQYYGKKHDKYPAEYVKTHRAAPNNLAWKEPLSAILSLWPDGRIKIEGSRSDWLFGVTPQKAGYSEYHDGRRTRPVIQSADMTFNYI